MKYAAPTTVDEARSLLADNPGSRVFAGATDLIPQMRSGQPEPSVMVDLKRIDQLMAISHDGGHWTIGAATPTSDLTRNAAFSTCSQGFLKAQVLSVRTRSRIVRAWAETCAMGRRPRTLCLP